MFAQTAHSFMLGAVLSRRTQQTWRLCEGRMATLFKPKTSTFSTSKSQERPKPLNVEPIRSRGDTFRLRPMNSVAEMSLLHEWTTAEGWTPGVFDALMFYQQDPTGCYLAEANGIPVGGFCVLRYGDNHAYGGQFIVRPTFREKRNGLEMAKKIAQMNSGRILSH